MKQPGPASGASRHARGVQRGDEHGVKRGVKEGGRHWQQGLSVVELMVGLTVGLIVVAGATTMMVNQLAEHRRLLLEVQVQQDLRAAADLILRDLKQAGSWASAQAGVWSQANPHPLENPYGDVRVSGSQLAYHYARHGDTGEHGGPEDHAVSSDEHFGFRVQDGRLDFLLGGRYQPLTDPATLRITGLRIQVTPHAIPLPDYCPAPCPPGSSQCPPVVEVREVSLSITGQATHDPQVRRSVDMQALLRNDRVRGGCG